MSSTCSSTSNKRARRKKLLLSATNYNISNIPEDVILSNIFIRLRAKQLARMRTLSKTWNYLLSHPSFIQSHLDRNNNNDDEILVVFYSSDFSPWEPFTAHPSTSPCEDLTNLIKPPHAPGASTVIGSVNGLICFASLGLHPHSLRIWNPSLSAMIALPPPYTCHTNIHDPEYAYDFRFGYDPKTIDYKVVKITYTFDSRDNIEELVHPVEVYSMRMDSWRQLTSSCNFPSHITCMCNTDEVYVDGYEGHVHWLCYIDTDWMLQSILAFDLNLETFSEILLPDCIQKSNNRDIALGVLSRKLCVISCIREQGDCCEVWVMDKYKVNSSWMKLHVLSGYSAINPIGFTLNNKFLFGHDVTLALYDPNAAASKLFKAIKPVYSSTKVALYVDSLVWPVPARSVIARN